MGFFDQFENTETKPKEKTKTGGSFFDQFEESKPEKSTSFFDQFDTPEQPQTTQPQQALPQMAQQGYDLTLSETPETIPETIKQPSPFMQEAFIEPAKTTYGNLMVGTANIADTLDFYSDKIANTLNIPKPEILNKLKESWATTGSQLIKEGTQNKAAKAVYGTIGAAIPFAAELLLFKGLKKFSFPAMMGVEGYKEGGTRGAIEGAAEGYLLGKIGEGIGYIPAEFKDYLQSIKKTKPNLHRLITQGKISSPIIDKAKDEAMGLTLKVKRKLGIPTKTNVMTLPPEKMEAIKRQVIDKVNKMPKGARAKFLRESPFAQQAVRESEIAASQQNITRPIIASQAPTRPTQAIPEQVIPSQVPIAQAPQTTIPIEPAVTQGMAVPTQPTQAPASLEQEALIQEQVSPTENIPETNISVEQYTQTPFIVREGTPPTKPPTPEKATPLNPAPLQEYKKPGLAQHVTSQSWYADKLGVRKLLEPAMKAKTGKIKEGNLLKKSVTKIFKDLEKSNINVKQFARTFNTNENPPANLSEKEKAAFEFGRDLTRDMWERLNAVRSELDMPLIRYRKGYFRHIADKQIDEILAGERELPKELSYLQKKLTKVKDNPMAYRREIEDAFLTKYSDDWEFVMKSMIDTSLEEIYMTAPKTILNNKLKEIDKAGTMPAETRKWINDFIDYHFENKQTKLDEMVDAIITETQAKDILNNFLKPFGKQLSQRPLTKMISNISKLPVYGAMGGVNPKQIIRNLFQTTQNMGLYGVTSTAKGMLPTTKGSTLEELLNKSDFLQNYNGLEGIEKNLLSKIKEKTLAPYQWSAVGNVKRGMKAAYYNMEKYFKDPKFKKFGWADPQRTYNEPKDFLYPSEIEKMLKEMEFGGQTLHYDYQSWGLPQVFRNKSLSPITRFGSWFLNYWMTFQRECFRRAFTGTPSYDNNVKFSPADRTNYLKYIILGGAILSSLGYYRSYMFGTAPAGLPPTAQLAMGLYNYTINSGNSSWEKKKRAQAAYQIKNAALMHIPLYLSVKDATSLLKGEKPLRDYLFYTKSANKKPSLPRSSGNWQRVRDSKYTRNYKYIRAKDSKYRRR